MSVSPSLSRRRLLGALAIGGAGALGAAVLPAASAAAAVPSPSGGVVPEGYPQLAPFATPGGLSQGSMVPQMIAAFDYAALGAYGAAGGGTAEVGEVSTTVDGILAAAGDLTTPFYDAWVDGFLSRADTTRAAADAAMTGGHPVSARHGYLRAASYYGQALFFVLGTSRPDRETGIYRSARDCWAAAAALMHPVFVPVQIPYAGPGGPLPGWFAAAPGTGPRPTVIAVNGSDGQLVDLYTFGGATALEHGFNVLLFEGPGQGAMLFERDVPVRPDWEAVVTPVVDFLLQRPEVDPDRIALTGVSFGGGLVLRAAAHEPRLRAVVADPGSVRPSGPFSDLAGLPNADFQGYAQGLSPTDRAILTSTLNKRAELFGASYRADALSGHLVDITGLYDTVATFDLDAATLAAVAVPALVLDYQDEQFFPGQSALAFAGLARSPGKQLYTFTRAQGAQLHDAPMAPQVHNDVIMDWLDDRFAEPRPAPPPEAPGSHSTQSGASELAATGASVQALTATAAAALVGGAALSAAGRRSAEHRSRDA